jgi:manganese/zinc/iron transport system permease protein
MIAISAAVAAASAVLGHVGAIVVPQLVGYHSTTTAGMMAVAAGSLFTLAVFFAPRYGVLVKFARRRLLSLGILTEDVLALLYRAEERSREHGGLAVAAMREILESPRLATLAARLWLRRRGEIERFAGGYALTAAGRQRARSLVRSHRLWEQYLVTTGGVAEDRLHDKAERLEHFTDEELRNRLVDATANPAVDPHGTPIPPE